MSPEDSVTIKDVARLAGVSIATVSRVINNIKGVKPATNEKVQNAIKLLNYQRNVSAASLKTKATKTIGIIIPEYSNTFFSKLLERIQMKLEPVGYSFISCTSFNSVENEKQKLKVLCERRVDVLVIVPAGNTGQHIHKIVNGTIPVILLDRKLNDLNCDVVLSNNKLGAYYATKALINQGYKRIGFIGGDSEIYTSRERFKGYKQAMIENNISIENDFVFHNGMFMDSGYHGMEKALSQINFPEAFFLVNDLVHIGASSFLNEKVTKQIRDKIAFASFDFGIYSPLLRFCRYFVEQKIDEMGDIASNIILKRLKEGQTGNYIQEIIDPIIRVMISNGGTINGGEEQKPIYYLDNKQYY